MKPRVAVVILCFNGIADTLACIESLRAAEPHLPKRDIIIVDNKSTDGTPEIVRSAQPGVTVICNEENLGYAAGNNVGIRRALSEGYDYILLLNNDTEVEPGFLGLLVESLQRDETIGVVGPIITYYDAPDTIWSAGGEINWSCGTTSMVNIGTSAAQPDIKAHEVDFISGCALLCRREVFEQAGMFDERFFMYYEETEWAVRVAQNGFRSVLVPAARIKHKTPLQDRIDKPYVAYYMTRNRLMFLATAGASARAWFHALILQDARTLLSYTLRPKWRGRRRQRDAMVQAWLDFLRGRHGRMVDRPN